MTGKFDNLMLENENYRDVAVIKKLVREILEAKSLDEAKAYAKVIGWCFDVEEADEVELVLQELGRSSKIQAIKTIRTFFGYGLKHSKDLVDNLPSTVGRLPREQAMDFKKEIENLGGKF